MTGSSTSRRVGDALRRPPHGVRVALVGLIGAAIIYALYEAAYALIPLESGRATAAWTAAAAVGAVTQHHLHRRITFATGARGYGSSLRRAVVVEAAVIALAAGLNLWLTESLGVRHRLAWLAAQAALFASKYVAMRFFVFRAPDDEVGEHAEEGGGRETV